MKASLLLGCVLSVISSFSYAGGTEVLATMSHLMFGVQNGRPEAEFFYPQIVGLRATGTVFDEETQTYVRKTGICTGALFNGGCLVSAKHCADRLNMNIESLEIFAGAEIGEGESIAIDVNQARYRNGKDLAVFRLGEAVSRYRSFSLADVVAGPPGPNEEPMIVGYGATKATKVRGPNGELSIKTSGSGKKHSGEVAINTFATSYNVTSRPEDWDAPKRGLPGDSGGPLLFRNKTTGKVVIAGIAETLDLNQGDNAYGALAPHRAWLRSTFKDLGCEDTSDPRANKPLADGLARALPNRGKYDYDSLNSVVADERFKQKVWEPLRQALYKELSGKAFSPKVFEHIGLGDIKRGDSFFDIRWAANLVRNEPAADTVAYRDIANKKLGVGTSWVRPKGVVRLHFDGRIEILED